MRHQWLVTSCYSPIVSRSFVVKRTFALRRTPMQWKFSDMKADGRAICCPEMTHMMVGPHLDHPGWGWYPVPLAVGASPWAFELLQSLSQGCVPSTWLPSPSPEQPHPGKASLSIKKRQ